MNEEHKGARGVAALLAPRNVAIVGASDRAGSWSITVNNSLTRIGFKGPIYPVNPRNETVWGGARCYKDLASLPEPPDHVVVLVPGRAVIDTIREAGRAGARSATIFSSGFGEGGDEEGRKLGEELSAAIAQARIAVSGPNCLGNLAAPSNFMTLTDRRIRELKRGPVAIFGQSGGIVTAIYRSIDQPRIAARLRAHRRQRGGAQRRRLHRILHAGRGHEGDRLLHRGDPRAGALSRRVSCRARRRKAGGRHQDWRL